MPFNQIQPPNPNQSIQPFILQKFQIIKKLGSGAYGHVWKVIQKSSGKTYALKKIFQAFQHSTDSQRTYRQISILHKLSHINIIPIYYVYLSRCSQPRDIYLVFQYMQTDLYKLIYQNLLQDVHKKYVLYQLVKAMGYLHKKGVVHRDLKPSNLLVNQKCEVKVCDFGLARVRKMDNMNGGIQQNDENNEYNNNDIMTQGVATRWYRAPQVLLGSNSYDQKADIWSIGCIMGQILLKSPLFPGSSTINQLQRILQFTGRPDYQDILSIDCQYAQKFIQQCSGFKQKSVKQYFNLLGLSSNLSSKLSSSLSDYQLLVDLTYKILKFNPKKRLTLEQILKHDYFSQFHNNKINTFDSSSCQISQNLSLKIQKQKRIKLQVDDNIKLSTQKYIQLMRLFDSSNIIQKEKENNQNKQIKQKKNQINKLNDNKQRKQKQKSSWVFNKNNSKNKENQYCNNNNVKMNMNMNEKSPVNNKSKMNMSMMNKTNNMAFTPKKTRMETTQTSKINNQHNHLSNKIDKNDQVSPQRFKDMKKFVNNTFNNSNIINKNVEKLGQLRFSKLISSQKLKKRYDSHDSMNKNNSIVKQTTYINSNYNNNNLEQFKQKTHKNIKLFSEIIKNKDSNRKNNQSKDKQNIQTNRYNELIKNISTKRIENNNKQQNLNYLSPINYNNNNFNSNNNKNFNSNNNNLLTTTSRVSFVGLKKTANLGKFNNNNNKSIVFVNK